MPCPTAVYLVDVHLHLKEKLLLKPFFDYIFVAQRDFVEVFRQMGNPHVYWLPLACDLEIHGVLPRAKEWDIGFVGQVHSGDRKRRLALLGERFVVNDYHRAYPREEIAEVYSRSRIVFNSSIKGDLNMRVFEGLASGSLVVTDRIGNGQSELFENGVHLLTSA